MALKANQQECSVDGCENKQRARTYCPKHWKRWRKYGDPTMAKFVPVTGGTDSERFWAKVEITGFCWNWTGAKGQHGHGFFNLGKETGWKGIGAHKFAWLDLMQEDTTGRDLDHLCRNPACVNPDHLEPVTHRENMYRGYAPGIRTRVTRVCKAGHNLDEVGFYTAASGRQTCKVCAAARSKRYLEKKRLAAQGREE